MIPKYVPLNNRYLQSTGQLVPSMVLPSVGRMVISHTTLFSSAGPIVCVYTRHSDLSFGAWWFANSDASHSAACAFGARWEEVGFLTGSLLLGHTLSQAVIPAIKPLSAIFQAMMPAKAYHISLI